MDPADPRDTVIAPLDAQPSANADSLVESLDRQYGIPGQAPYPAPPPPAAALDRYAVPEALSARHPKGGLIAMRLLSRMQADLAELTQDKRPATYEEVDKFLGYALVAEGIAPRDYTAEQAAQWWSTGGSAALRAGARDGADGGSTTKDVAEGDDSGTPSPGTGPDGVDEGLSYGQDDGSSGAFSPAHPVGDSRQDAATDVAAPEVSDASTPPEAASTTENASEALADPTLTAPSAADLNGKPPADPKAALAEARKQAVLAVNAAAAAAKTSTAEPAHADLSTLDKGFGDSDHGFHGDYRTTPKMRDWLRGPKPLAGADLPYPDGPTGADGWSIEGGRKVRAEVAYLYTLPEVKAFLDLIAQLEGPHSNFGYNLSHGARPAKLPDLDTFHGGDAASGRYQIKAEGWKKIGGRLWSRQDFSPFTQDLIAITLLRNCGATSELLKGHLSAALTLASREFASIPVSLAVDHSYYSTLNDKKDAKGNLVRGTDGRPAQEERLQSNPIDFRDLPAEFTKHLEFRQAEFQRAKQEWEAHKTLPWAFIPPTRWQAFGIPGFDRPKQKAN
jgi:hypothetical protein